MDEVNETHMNEHYDIAFHAIADLDVLFKQAKSDLKKGGLTAEVATHSLLKHSHKTAQTVILVDAYEAALKELDTACVLNHTLMEINKELCSRKTTFFGWLYLNLRRVINRKTQTQQ